MWETFKQRNSFIVDQIAHTLERPFVCRDVGKYYQQKKNLLIVQQRVNTGERPQELVYVVRIIRSDQLILESAGP
jgi:hypothetical protein